MLKKTKFKHGLHAVLFTLGAATLCAQALAQSYPSKPVTVVVPYAPGATDQAARKLADELAKQLGQPVVIENKDGAGGVIGTQYIARAKPDGYTLLFAAPAVITVAPLLGNAQYKYEDIMPVAQVTTSPHVLAARADAPFKSGKELIDYAKANPGKVVFGSSGTGTAVHLAGEAFAKSAGIEFTHAPYRGLAPAVTAALGGFVDLVIGLPVAIKPQVDGGKLRAIAQFGATRAPSLPDVPTLKELGVDLTLGVDIGLFAPAGTPDDVIVRIDAAVEKAVASADFQTFVNNSLSVPAFLDAAGYSKVVGTERDLYAKIVPELKLGN